MGGWGDGEPAGAGLRGSGLSPGGDESDWRACSALATQNPGCCWSLSCGIRRGHWGPKWEAVAPAQPVGCEVGSGNVLKGGPLGSRAGPDVGCERRIWWEGPATVGQGGAGRLLVSRAGCPDWGSEKEPGLETDTERHQLLIKATGLGRPGRSVLRQARRPEARVRRCPELRGREMRRDRHGPGQARARKPRRTRGGSVEAGGGGRRTSRKKGR